MGMEKGGGGMEEEVKRSNEGDMEKEVWGIGYGGIRVVRRSEAGGKVVEEEGVIKEGVGVK